MEHRRFRIYEFFRDGFCRLRIDPRLHGHMAVFVSSVPEIFVHLSGEHIHRDIDENRARTTGFSKAERTVKDLRKCFHVIDSPASLAHRFHDTVLIAIRMHLDLLMRMTAVIVARNIACDEDHRNGV